MSKPDIFFPVQDLRHLADIGMMAASRGMRDSAATIFSGLRALRPELEAGLLGQAIVSLLGGDCAAAVKTLEMAPPSAAVRVFLGMALLQVGDRQRARRVLLGVVQLAPTTAFADLAEALMSSADAMKDPNGSPRR